MNSRYSDIFLARIEEIEVCLSAECYIAALSLALTLPDICGKAQFPDESKNGSRYKQWYDENIGMYEKLPSEDDVTMPYLSGEVVYSLRNNFVHAGNPNIEKDKIQENICKIDYFELEIGQADMGDCAMVGYDIKDRIHYSVNVRAFCKKLISVAKNYYSANKEKFTFFNYHLTEV